VTTDSSVCPVDLCTICALMSFGVRLAPTSFPAAFLGTFAGAVTALVALIIGAGNTREAVIGCYLVNRFAGGCDAFQRSQNIFKFVLMAGMVGTAVSATIGTTTLHFAHLAEPSRDFSIWLTWWLGDGLGALVMTPLLLLW